MEIKKITYYLFLLSLLAPMLLGKLKLVDEKPLMGDFYSKKDTVLTMKGWFDGSFQEKREAYINENFGFRNFFVRLNNQVLFSGFNIAKANNVVIGKQQYLFGEDYIKAYYGQNYIGGNKIRNTVRELQIISNDLKAKGKALIVIITPNKCYYYPEYIPSQYDTIKTTTNYETYLKELAKTNILLIDFNRWMISQKAKSRTPLFPKTGIHWNNYGAALAADSLQEFLNFKANIQTPGFEIIGKENSSIARNPDRDIEDGCNLLFDIAKPEYTYPKIKPLLGGKKPKAFIVSDSYYWNWSWYGLDTMMFDNPQMGYYYSELYDIKKGMDAHSLIYNYGVEKLLNESDVVILMCTEGKLDTFPWGFIEGYKNPKGELVDPKIKKSLVDETMGRIKNDKEWMKGIRKKATEKSISIDSMIRLDAEYVVGEDLKNRVK